MTSREQYRKAEHCLRNYRKNIARLEYLRAELKELQGTSDVHAQDYQGRVMLAAGAADPVGMYVQKILTLEHRISLLEKYTLPVQRLREDLSRSTDPMSRHMLLILDQYYLSGTTASRLLEVTGWSRSTFYSRCLSIVGLAVSYFVESED